MIPQSIIDEYVPKAKDSTFFGELIESLSREELITCAVMGWEAEKRVRGDASRERRFVFSLRR